MDVRDLVSIGSRHVRNLIAEEIYFRLGYDYTKPVTFSGLVNERCNVKCRYCAYWRLDSYQQEMTIEEWQQALLSIKAFVGPFSINFSGGEPFIKPGFLDLLSWCRGEGIRSGVTTNGSALTARNATKLVGAKPFNLNVSVDAPDAETHDYLRGYPGLFESLSRGIGYVRAEQKQQNARFPIMIKPTITARNFRSAPDMIAWAQRVGASCVNFQPLERWTPETQNELWIDDERDRTELQSVVDRLIDLKRQGAPILNAERTLNRYVAHFAEEPPTKTGKRSRLGLQNFSIRTNGDIQLGQVKPIVGNIRKQSAHDIWRSSQARNVRQKIARSSPPTFLDSSSSRQSLWDKVRMAALLMRN